MLYILDLNRRMVKVAKVQKLYRFAPYRIKRIRLARKQVDK